jgi:hypothetical protein
MKSLAIVFGAEQTAVLSSLNRENELELFDSGKEDMLSQNHSYMLGKSREYVKLFL